MGKNGHKNYRGKNPSVVVQNVQGGGEVLERGKGGPPTCFGGGESFLSNCKGNGERRGGAASPNKGEKRGLKALPEEGKSATPRSSTRPIRSAKKAQRESTMKKREVCTQITL